MRVSCINLLIMALYMNSTVDSFTICLIIAITFDNNMFENKQVILKISQVSYDKSANHNCLF